MSETILENPPGQEPSPACPVDAREDLKAKLSQWQAKLQRQAELPNKLEAAKNLEIALLEDTETGDSEETVHRLQDAQTKQRVYTTQIAQAERDSDAAYDALVLSFRAVMAELAKKVQALRESRKAVHWEIVTDRIDTLALRDVGLTEVHHLSEALNCTKDILPLAACQPHQWAFLRNRYTSLNPGRPEPAADLDTVKRGIDNVLACYSKFEAEAAKVYRFKPYRAE
jgi:hypothetical protein